MGGWLQMGETTLESLDREAEERRQQKAQKAIEDLHEQLKSAFMAVVERPEFKRIWKQYKKMGRFPRLHLDIKAKAVHRRQKTKLFHDFTNDEMCWRVIVVLVKREGKVMSAQALADEIKSTQGSVYQMIPKINEAIIKDLKAPSKLICSSRKGYWIEPRYRILSTFKEK